MLYKDIFRQTNGSDPMLLKTEKSLNSQLYNVCLQKLHFTRIKWPFQVEIFQHVGLHAPVERVVILPVGVL